MGMDPIKAGELCEVTIVLEGGPVSPKALKKFREVIDEAIEEADKICDHAYNNKTLDVRLTRFIIR